MTRLPLAGLVITVLLAACGGGDDDADETGSGDETAADETGSGDGTAGADSGSEDVEPADGVTTLAAGLNHADGDWMGAMRVDIPNPDGEGVIGYSPRPVEGITLATGSVVVDGSSMSYSGPMQPPNDGNNPPPVEVGDGTISATC